jgi:hypothetical protein
MSTATQTEHELTLVRSGAPKSQVDRWGCAVEIAISNDVMLLTINVPEHRAILREVLEEFAAEGIAVSVDEP